MMLYLKHSVFMCFLFWERACGGKGAVRDVYATQGTPREATLKNIVTGRILLLSFFYATCGNMFSISQFLATLSELQVEFGVTEMSGVSMDAQGQDTGRREQQQKLQERLEILESQSRVMPSDLIWTSDERRCISSYVF